MQTEIWQATGNGAASVMSALYVYGIWAVSLLAAACAAAGICAARE